MPASLRHRKAKLQHKVLSSVPLKPSLEHRGHYRDSGSWDAPICSGCCCPAIALSVPLLNELEALGNNTLSACFLRVSRNSTCNMALALRRWPFDDTMKPCRSCQWGGVGLRVGLSVSLVARMRHTYGELLRN